MGEWHKEQPRDGNIILHCGHVGDARSGASHWWKFPSPVSFHRPDGTQGLSEWIVSCQACNDAADGDAAKIAIRGDGKWNGDAPIIPEGS